ncbi:hypothetical protein ACFLRB_01880 [Acidobacteriota bacterium]
MKKVENDHWEGQNVKIKKYAEILVYFLIMRKRGKMLIFRVKFNLKF